MSNSPSPLNSQRLLRASAVGVGLAVFGILAFVGLWVVLGNAGFPNAARLFAAMCIPPIVIGVLLGSSVAAILGLGWGAACVRGKTKRDRDR